MEMDIYAVGESELSTSLANWLVPTAEQMESDSVALDCESTLALNICIDWIPSSPKMPFLNLKHKCHVKLNIFSQFWSLTFGMHYAHSNHAWPLLFCSYFYLHKVPKLIICFPSDCSSWFLFCHTAVVDDSTVHLFYFEDVFPSIVSSRSLLLLSIQHFLLISEVNTSSSNQRNSKINIIKNY